MVKKFMIISKIKNLIFLTLFSFSAPLPLFAGNLFLKSYGHSSFLIEGGGKSVLLNPFKSIGCASGLEEPKNSKVDFVLASSRLADEGYYSFNKLFFVDPGSYRINNIYLNGISIPHDRVKGRRFGMATVWIWEQNDFKIVHMGGAAGDINITNEILLSRPDILFISIGGGIKSYNGVEASKIVKQLNPKAIIPVHFLKSSEKKENCDFSDSEEFLENMGETNIKFVDKEFVIGKNDLKKMTIYFVD